jgi:N6-L-threonylcarbamoyladenine synthase
MDDGIVKILSIETSCDETAMAFVECAGGKAAPRFAVRAECVASQIDIHRPFGGVVPNLAKREHLKNLPVVLAEIKRALAAQGAACAPDRIAVTVGPGLEPALWTGINFAAALSQGLGAPVVGANHMEGHLFSNWLSAAPQLPAVALIVSGGHTMLVHMEAIDAWRLLGETKDDAAGEAFDKVARLLGLPYPGGPEIERLAQKYRGETPIGFPRPMLHSKDYDFSFSGLKTAVAYYVRDNPCGKAEQVQNICASFQAAVADVLVQKTMRAARACGARSVLIAGGVAANDTIARALEKAAGELDCAFCRPASGHNTDNAAMIAAAAYLGKEYPHTEAAGSLSL